MCALQGKSACPEVAQVCSLLSFWVFPSPSFISTSMIHLELIFVYGVRKGLVFIFHTFNPEETLLSLGDLSFWDCLGASVKNPWASYLWVWSWSLSCSRSGSTPPPCSLRPDVRGFVGHPGSGGANPTLPIFSKMAFPFPGSWHFQIDFRTHQQFPQRGPLGF